MSGGGRRGARPGSTPLRRAWTALAVLTAGLAVGTTPPAPPPGSPPATPVAPAARAAPVTEPEERAPAPPVVETRYALDYEARILASERAARVAVRLPDHDGAVRSIRFRVDPERHLAFQGNGGLDVREGFVTWEPPARDAVLRYQFRIDHLRDAASYDARCAEQWALFRGEDLVPPVRVVTRDGATSRARLALRLPQGWSSALPYEKGGDGRYELVDPERRFDRPKGWMVLGHLGVLRERVAGSRLAIAGPTGQGLRRHDILALLRWTLPELRDAVGALPERLLVVSAGDPMWRGGLSGPSSLFVHADRPLITSDLSSPVLHELVHVAMGARSAPGGDWIVEGLAELYSLELLVRSRTVSRRRFERALEAFAERGRAAGPFGDGEASGAVTAKAVTVLRALDLELQEATTGEAGLDDVLARLAAARRPVGVEELRAAAEAVAGRGLGDFFATRLR